MSNLHKAGVNWSSESVTFRIRRWSLSSMWHSFTFNHITNSWVCGGVYYLNCRVIASMSFQFGSADIIQFSFVDIINSHHWCRQWLGAKQAPSHYLNQWWLKSLKHWCVARDQCYTLLILRVEHSGKITSIPWQLMPWLCLIFIHITNSWVCEDGHLFDCTAITDKSCTASKWVTSAFLSFELPSYIIIFLQPKYP